MLRGDDRESSREKWKPLNTRAFSHSPRVKSGNFIGALPFATDISVSGNGALHAAASYTS